MKRHVTRRYSAKRNPLYQKRVKSPIPGIISALAGVIIAIYFVYMIVENYSDPYASGRIMQDRGEQMVMVKMEV